MLLPLLGSHLATTGNLVRKYHFFLSLIRESYPKTSKWYNFIVWAARHLKESREELCLPSFLWGKLSQTIVCNKLGVITLVSEISCIVHHAKLPNFVVVAVLGFIYFLRKMKAFRPLAERRYEDIIFEWIHWVDHFSWKPSFMLKIVQNPFLQTWDGYMVEVLDGALVKENPPFFSWLPMFRIFLFLVSK